MSFTHDPDQRFLRSLPPGMPADVASDRLRRHRAQRERTWVNWDKLIASQEFADYLTDRLLAIVPIQGVAPALEMERAALGAMMMLDDAAVTVGMCALRSEHFSTRWHRHTFSAICALERRRRTGVEKSLCHIDMVAVADQLARWGIFDESTSAYLAAMIDTCPSSANIDYYISRVIENSRLRHLELLGRDMAELARRPDADQRRISALGRLALYRIRQDGWCDLQKLLEQVSK